MIAAVLKWYSSCWLIVMDLESLQGSGLEPSLPSTIMAGSQNKSNPL